MYVLEYCESEKLVTGASTIPDWCIKASSLKSGTIYDTRLTNLPGKAKPKGWLAATPDASASSLSEEWVQVCC